MPKARKNKRSSVPRVLATAGGAWRHLPGMLAASLARGVSRLLHAPWVAVALVVLLVVNTAVLLSAFEAHIINVTAQVVQIDPPVITPPSGEYDGPLDIGIDDSDSDATHIFYTITPGQDPSLAPDPTCGIYPGGAKPLGPITLDDDSVVKAIACDGDSVLSHFSLITTEIYDLSLVGKIEGRKYHDLDKSGTVTLGDTLVQGWRVDLRDDLNTTVLQSTVTDASGYYAFNNVSPGNYLVVEEDRPGWQHITPSSVADTVSGSETDTVNFFNFDTGFACVPESISFPANLAVQVAGSSISSSNDDVAIANNTTVNGDVYSNDAIQKNGNSNGPRTINGNATRVNTIDPVFTVTGTSTTGPATTLPNIQIPIWKQKAQDGGTVNGSFTFPNSTVGIVMGPTEIMGDVTFGNSNSVTIKGPLYIHGNLSIGAGSSIIQDSGFGNQFVTIIVDGTIDVNANVAFVGAASYGTFLLVSTHAAISTDSAISLNSNSSDVGRVVLYASDGDIHVDSNRTLLALFATHGTGTDTNDLSDAAITIDSNVTVNYQTLPTTISCGPRQPYDSTSHVLINEFMPNPTLGKVGTAGLPHDGEWVEIFNPTVAAVDLAGYVLYDAVNTHALPITTANTNTGGTTIPSLGYLVVYRDGDADFDLAASGGDTARLFTAAIGSGGVLVDSHTYVRDAPTNKSFARVPDGASNWVDPDATPGESNVDSFLFSFLEPLPGESDVPPVLAEDKPALLTEVIIPDVVPPPPPPEEQVVAEAPAPEGLVAGEQTEAAPSDTPPADAPPATTEPAPDVTAPTDTVIEPPPADVPPADTPAETVLPGNPPPEPTPPPTEPAPTEPSVVQPAPEAPAPEPSPSPAS